MDQKEKPGKISRRNFLGKAGAGVIGGYVVLPTLGAIFPKDKTVAEVTEPIDTNVELQKLSLIVNKKKIEKMVPANMTLAEFLRDELKLTGTKVICNHGECGGCTVVLDGKAVYSCQTLVLDADGKEVITIEGLMVGEELHAIQKAFIEKDGYQCGFCTPGQIMTAYAFLQKNPKPSRAEIKKAMAGNLCRCAAYPKIIDSVEEASKRI